MKRALPDPDSDDGNDKTTAGFPKKKRKETCATQQKYRSEYAELWPCLEPSKKGASYVFCKLCHKDFTCSHGGKNDCQKHVNSQYHKSAKGRASSMLKTVPITGFMEKKKDSETDTFAMQVVTAEVTMCEMIAELNLPLSCADSFVKTFQKMFPDSKIAKAMQCCRNKTTEVIKEVAKVTKEDLIVRMETQPFTVSTDGGNDAETKQFPIVVRTFNPESRLITSELLDLAVCTGSATGEKIFDLLDSELDSAGINWEGCLALGCDNANVMVGKHNGVIAHIRKKNEKVFLSGCTLHTVHNGAKRAANTALPPFEDILTDIYYYFRKSSCRIDRFKGDQDMCGLEQKRMLKHVCTRWLSISRCLGRMMENWEALRSFFTAEKAESESSASQSNSKISTIVNFLRSPTNRLCAHFLLYVHTLFDSSLLSFQAEEPKIHLLHRALKRLVRTIMQHFLKPTAFQGRLLHEVQYNLGYNHKTNDDLLIGDAAREMLKNKQKNHLRDERIGDFFAMVKQYFQILTKHLVEKLPLRDPLLENAQVADPTSRKSSTSAQQKFFMDRFPSLLQGSDQQSVLLQFADFQGHELSGLDLEQRVDQMWLSIADIEDEIGQKCFKELAKVMCGILTIPHSSAHCERIFSCVRKNRTEQRASLSDHTLESLLLLKSRPGSFGEHTYTRKQLERFKSAYYSALTKRKTK